jgi:hypothetical protein
MFRQNGLGSSHPVVNSEIASSFSDRKSDQVDAEKLARYALLDPKSLRPIVHRTVAQQEALTLIRARNLMCSVRMGESPLYDSGVCTWLTWRQAIPQSGHRRHCSQARRSASSHLDDPRAIHPVLWGSSLRKEIMSNYCGYPASR